MNALKSSITKFASISQKNITNFIAALSHSKSESYIMIIYFEKSSEEDMSKYGLKVEFGSHLMQLIMGILDSDETKNFLRDIADNKTKKEIFEHHPSITEHDLIVFEKIGLIKKYKVVSQEKPRRKINMYVRNVSSIVFV